MQQPELGLKITELRKQKGLTQEELVDQCNINVRTLQRIESGDVSPRIYTIKTILSALDYDYETLQGQESAIRVDTIAPIPKNEIKSTFNQLTITWIAGVLFLVVALFEGIGDYVRFEDDELIYGQWGHVTVKFLALFLNVLLLYGFLISGRLLKNYLMKVTTILLFVALCGFYVYDIISVFNASLEMVVVLLAESITFGALGVLFGVAILKSRDILGNTGLASGILELLLAGCYLTVVLSPMALFLFFPVVILEVLVLYKVSSKVKDQMQ
ncbi:helix-turn-helix transcriptional regulator [uncultured Croceitalea sp.]|uniref:helix-turn-helix domain-containing protein n=1 Tax=uncultured Croceitalea sp. TaxID=1798908 RepID=UPI00330664A7